MPVRETVIVEAGVNPMSVVAGILFAVSMVFVGYLVFFGSDGNRGTATLDVPAISVDVVPDGR
jgi:hypothetical protein